MKYALQLLLLLTTARNTQNFAAPVFGISYQFWTILNCVDLDSNGDVLDWQGYDFFRIFWGYVIGSCDGAGGNPDISIISHAISGFL